MNKCPVCENIFQEDKNGRQKYCCKNCGQRAFNRMRKNLPIKDKNTEERFWSYVDKNPGHGPNGDCWTWLAGVNYFGYGLFTNNKQQMRAHRFSWEITNGTISNEMQINHHCDNPPCVNPAHLYIGTQKDNIKDAISRNRMKYISHSGEDNGNSVLSLKKVLDIRKIYKDNKISQSKLAKMFDVSEGTIYNVVNHITWK